LYDAGLQDVNFDTLVIDEAAQCLEPMAWLIIPMAEKLVLAGDHHQLPPTVLSQEAIKLGFSRSILEVAIEKQTPVYLLNTQYRMHAAIAGFSSQYFYDGRLQSAPHLQGPGTPVCFIDTAGSGFSETHGPDGVSLQNEGELRLAAHWLKSGETAAGQWAFIAPYAGQVAAARAILPEGMRISTVDSFQGQEHERIMISLVRSNDEGDIGFLKDYRRMNVAITRAKQQLVVIGDSATIGADPFYAGFLRYVEAHGEYRSVWEFDLG
jgi:superfamily I DNA and/or RNA helicase